VLFIVATRRGRSAGIGESEHQASPGVASCRLPPASTCHCRQANRFRSQALPQRSSGSAPRYRWWLRRTLGRFMSLDL